MSGLPATGKTTVARSVARELAATFVRIDTIEAAISRAEGAHEHEHGWDQPPGYVVGYEVAADQLRIGLDVVAESVNALNQSRDAWREVAERARARVVEVELVCSDPAEHRRRLAGRTIDVDGVRNPTWDEVLRREYEPWTRDPLTIDTAVSSADDAVRSVLDHVHTP